MRFLACIFSGLAVFLSAASADKLEEKKADPMSHMVAAVTVDGVALVSRSDEVPITLRIAGGDHKNAKAYDGQLWVATPRGMIQQALAPVASFAPGKKDSKEILAAHTAWECKHHNELTRQDLKATPVFETLGKQVWAHWTYDLAAVSKRINDEREAAGEERLNGLAKTQHLLCTVVGDYVLLLVSSSLDGQDEAETKRLLVDIAATLVIRDKALKDSEIKAFCSEPASKIKSLSK